MGKNLIALLLLPLLAYGQWEMDFDEDWLVATSRQAVPQFRVTFLTGTIPTNIVLHADYTGPATAANALYDSGDGVWTAYTSKNIPVVGSYVAFAGDWRTAAGTYANMFHSTFQSAAYTARMSGMLTQKPSANASAYVYLFTDCTAITQIQDNPMPLLTGTPAGGMFGFACQNMSGVTGALPDGFMDTSGLTGAPAASMFYKACYGMSKVTSLPDGFMDTSGLTGAPAASMFQYACKNMTGVTSLPDGFMDISGLTGAPAASMLQGACQYMSKVTSLPDGFMDTSGLTGTPAVHIFYAACQGMGKVTSLPDGFMDTSGLTGTPAEYMYRFACDGMSGVTNAYTCNIGAGVTLNATNAVGQLYGAWQNMTEWPGTVMWGTNVLFSQFAPTNRIYTIYGSTNVPGYDGFDTNWK